MVNSRSDQISPYVLFAHDLELVSVIGMKKQDEPRSLHCCPLSQVWNFPEMRIEGYLEVIASISLFHLLRSVL